MSASLSDTLRRLERCHQWYEVRFRRLRDLVKTLPEETQKAYWNIVANGTADWRETHTYEGHMNRLCHERDGANKRAEDLEMMLARMVRVTRSSEDPAVASLRAQARTLLKKSGILRKAG